MQIKEDLTKTKFILDAINEVATEKSSSIIKDTANGETGIFQNIADKVSLFDASKKFVNDPKNQKARETLLNKKASPEDMKQAANQLNAYLAKEMGLKPSEIKIMLDKQYKGATSSETKKAYIAGNLIDNMGGFVNTVHNENSDLADLQRDAGVEKTDNYVGNRVEYSKNFGNLGQKLLESQYAANGSSINNTSYNKIGTNLSKPNELNQTVVQNTRDFNKLDKAKIAHRQLNNTEITFLNNKDTIKAFAKQKYKTNNPTNEQLQGAQHSLSQQAMIQTDKAWSLVLGNEEDKEAKAFLQTNKGDLFKVKNQQEFNNGTTNGDTLVADLAGSDFTKIKNFTKENTQKTTKESLEKKYVSDLGDRVVDTAAQVYEGVKNLPEATKKALIDAKDYISNASLEDVKDAAKSLLNSMWGFGEDVVDATESLAKNTTDDKTSQRMNELYGDDSASRVQGYLASEKVAEGVMALTGVTAIAKAGLKKVLLPNGDKKLDNIARDNKGNQLLLTLDKDRNTPEDPNKKIISYPATGKEKVYIALSDKQVLDDGKLDYVGNFSTKDKILSEQQVREYLAVTPKFKKDISYVVEGKFIKGTQLQESTVASQNYKGKVYPGGGNQIEVLKQKNESIVNDVFIPTSKPKSIKQIEQEIKAEQKIISDNINKRVDSIKDINTSNKIHKTIQDPSIKIIDKNLIEVKRKYDLAEVRLKPYNDKKDKIKQDEEVNKLANASNNYIEKKNTILDNIKEELEVLFGAGD